MTINWPAGLPQYFLRDGYQETDPDNLISSDTSIGPAKLRRRSTAAIRLVSGSVIMSETQYATFRDFRRQDIKDGATPFVFPDPHGGDPLLVRFHQVPSYSTEGINWRVTLSLEVLP